MIPRIISLRFEQPVLQRQIGHAFLQGTGFAAQVPHFAAGRGTGSIACQTTLSSLHELLRPSVIQALRDAFLAAQLGDTIITAQAFQHDPDLVLSRKMPPCCTANVLHDKLGRGLGLARVFWSHLRSFVTTTRPKHSLNHNIKSAPLVLTGNRMIMLHPRAS
jgi:hypothetical protein